MNNRKTQQDNLTLCVTSVITVDNTDSLVSDAVIDKAFYHGAV